MDDATADTIRDAVAAGDYARALGLWERYAARAHERAGQGLLTAEELSEVLGLVEWSRRVVVCARAHGRDELCRLQVAVEYEASASADGPTVHSGAF